MNVSVTEAKASFSKILRLAEGGEEISVTRYGKVIARIVPTAAAPAKKPSLAGAMRGKIWISDDFDKPLGEFQDYIK